MALKINTELQAADGSTVDAGTFIRFSTFFPTVGLTYSCNLTYYRSKEAYDSGFSGYQPVGFQIVYEKQLNPEDFMSLTPIQVHMNLKEIIENIIGLDTVEIVLV